MEEDEEDAGNENTFTFSTTWEYDGFYYMYTECLDLEPGKITKFRRIQVSKNHYRCLDLEIEAVLTDAWKSEVVKELDRIM